MRQQLLRVCSALTAAVLVTATLLAQSQSTAPFEPKVGQAGKDVVWVPTPDNVVTRMLDIANVTAEDFVIDLGSGDGRTVIAAARRGARAHGIEFNPQMVELSRRAAAAQGLATRATFVQGDLFESDFSRATVLTMFLLPEINMRLRPAILNLRPGTRVVSNTFMMEDWRPDESAEVANCPVYCMVHLWIVPAKVEGTWRLPAGDLEVRQQFQNLQGTLTAGGRTNTMVNGRLRGNRVSFTLDGAQYVGLAAGDAIDFTIRSASGTTAVRATRIRR
jgi:SAM-dependent methyltransferase